MGIKGEQFFIEHFVPAQFGTRAEEFIDERCRHREGDFRWGGHLFEVKSDAKCLSQNYPTKNVPVELYHSGHVGGKGFYTDCYEQGVDW